MNLLTCLVGDVLRILLWKITILQKGGSTTRNHLECMPAAIQFVV